jgi:hypothetical protein
MVGAGANWRVTAPLMGLARQLMKSRIKAGEVGGIQVSRDADSPRSNEEPEGAALRRGQILRHRHVISLIAIAAGLTVTALSVVGLAESGRPAKHIIVATAPVRPVKTHPTATTSGAGSNSSSSTDSRAVPAISSIPPGTTSSTIGAAGQTPCGLGDLSFSVSTDRSTYVSGTNVVVRATASNRSSHPCVFDPVDRNRGECEPEVIVQDYDLYPPPAGIPTEERSEEPCPPGMTSALLQPGRSSTVTFELDGTLSTEAQSGTFNQGPGRYLLSVMWGMTDITCKNIARVPYENDGKCIAQTEFQVIDAQASSTTTTTTPTTTMEPATTSTTSLSSDQPPTSSTSPST